MRWQSTNVYKCVIIILWYMENYPSDSQVPTIILSSPGSVDECCAMYPLVNNTYNHMDVYQMISLFSQMLCYKNSISIIVLITLIYVHRWLVKLTWIARVTWWQHLRNSVGSNVDIIPKILFYSCQLCSLYTTQLRHHLSLIIWYILYI